jgi:hypothetical protein
MSTIGLQESIIQKIRSINDEGLLNYLNQLLGDEEEKNTIYQTTPEQKASIKEGQEQIANGYFYTNEQVEKEIDEWLGKE